MKKHHTEFLRADINFDVDAQGDFVYVEVKGKRIAKRYRGQHWISLDPAYRVEGEEPGNYKPLTIIHYRGRTIIRYWQPQTLDPPDA
jgi:hypothetical protein